MTVLLLALNLVSVGLLARLVAGRIPPASGAGLRGFGAGAVLLGLAFGLRFQVGLSDIGALTLLADAVMVCGSLHLVSSMGALGGGYAWQSSKVAVLTLLYLVLALPLNALLPSGQGRAVALNITLASCYALLALKAAHAARVGETGASIRAPLLLTAMLNALLALSLASRVVIALTMGPGPLYAGFWSQLHYGYATVAAMLLGPCVLWVAFMRMNDTLTQLATHDSLTGLLNRNGLDKALGAYFGSRPPTPLFLLHADVDHFKRINDAHGHLIGDQVLLSVANTLQRTLRAGDFVARLGGEEFLIGVAVANPDEALALADRLRLAVAAETHAFAAGTAVDCTISVGVSPPCTTLGGWEMALREADRALYAAKHGGRNQVVLAPAPAGWRPARMAPQA